MTSSPLDDCIEKVLPYMTKIIDTYGKGTSEKRLFSYLIKLFKNLEKGKLAIGTAHLLYLFTNSITLA